MSSPGTSALPVDERRVRGASFGEGDGGLRDRGDIAFSCNFPFSFSLAFVEGDTIWAIGRGGRVTVGETGEGRAGKVSVVEVVMVGWGWRVGLEVGGRRVRLEGGGFSIMVVGAF